MHICSPSSFHYCALVHLALLRLALLSYCQFDSHRFCCDSGIIFFCSLPLGDYTRLWKLLHLVAVIQVFVIIRIYLWIRDFESVCIEIVVLIIIALGFYNLSDLDSCS